MPAYLTIGTNLLYWALCTKCNCQYYFPDSHWSISGTFTMPWWKRKSNTSITSDQAIPWKADIGLNSKAAGRKHFLGANIHGGIYDLEK